MIIFPFIVFIFVFLVCWYVFGFWQTILLLIIGLLIIWVLGFFMRRLLWGGNG